MISYLYKPIILSLLLAALLISCSKMDFSPRTVEPGITDPDPNGDTTLRYNAYVAKWILSNMQKNYLWSDKIPSTIDTTAIPSIFFTSILHKDDFHSQLIHSEDIITNETPRAGYDYTLLSIIGSQNIYAYINYVEKGSPAESAGLRRGDLFVKINGTALTRSNYTELMRASNTIHSLTLAIVDASNNLIPTKEITISVAYFKENPIHLDTVYKLHGKNIGYLVYNSFTADDDKLNNIFKKFTNENITDLVIDLRYNGGGEVANSLKLASLIMGPSYENKIFTKRSYNDNVQAQLLEEYGEEYLIDKFLGSINNAPINDLKLSKLHILISYRTSSASELIINGLRPYIEVVLIGRDATAGKNVGLTVISSDDSKIIWELHPVVVRMSNSENFSDYTQGFNPTIWKNEYNIGNTRELGNLKELLLSEAIYQITGIQENETYSEIIDNLSGEPIVSSKEILHPNTQNMYINKFKKTLN